MRFDTKFSLIAWCTVAIAILAWAGVASLVSAVEGERSNQSAAAQSEERATDASAEAARIHGLAQGTAPERAALGNALNASVFSIAGMIEAAGASADVSLKLSGAQSEQASGSSSSGATIQAVGFAVDADGTFAGVMRAADLLQSLPVPSLLERLELSRATGKSGSASWRMSAYLRVLITSSVSS